jgi:quercetin dioxygenase-like cupin family protein
VSYSRVNVHDLEGAGPGGAMRFVRRELGVQAFGINWIELAPDAVGREHDERESGQEEVYVALRGEGVLRVAGEEVELRPGHYVLVAPEETRQVVAGPHGLSYLVVGARVEGEQRPR